MTAKEKRICRQLYGVVIAYPHRIGLSPSGKAWDFGSHIRRFESDNPCSLVRFGS